MARRREVARDELETLVRRGLPLAEIARQRGVTRAAISKAVKADVDLRSAWVETRPTVLSKQAKRRWQMISARLAATVRGAALLQFARDARARGWSVEVGRSTRSAMVAGTIPVVIHVPGALAEGDPYYQIRVNFPSALNVVLLPKGVRVYWLPEVGVPRVRYLPRGANVSRRLEEWPDYGNLFVAFEIAARGRAGSIA